MIHKQIVYWVQIDLGTNWQKRTKKITLSKIYTAEVILS